MIKIFLGNCVDVMNSNEFKGITKDREIVVVTDPPFNIGYHYKNYKDKLSEQDYLKLLGGVLELFPAVVIHYPEALYKTAIHTGKAPERVVSWCYNSNTAKQHRDIAFFGVVPDMNRVRQPYKNPNDKRIRKLIADGKTGGRLYDWWNINQVKNTSREKVDFPCQMPLEVMGNIIGILPRTEKTLILDPFMGSGTTGVVCEKYNIDFVGIDIDESAYRTAGRRLEIDTN